MKLVLYIIWILLSVAVWSKTMETKKFEWLAVPSALSSIIGMVMWFFELMKRL